MRNRPLLAAGAALLLVFWQVAIAWKAGVLYGDFHAFYCAGHAVLQGANPYTAAALHPCESAHVPSGFSFAPADVVVPAPLPGYALLVFAPFAVLPYTAACIAWLIVILACIVLSARALSIVLERPIDLMLWTLIIGFAVTSIPTGEIGAPLIASLLWMAVFLRREAWALAAVAGGVAMLVPHVGLPAVLAAFLLIPRMRLPVIITGVVLAALDVLCSGPSTAFSYFTQVLPAHARAEIDSSMQYGMTWILHGAGLPEHAALAGGEVSYAIMMLLGIAAAYALRRHGADLAFVALVPPSFAVAGGTFIHYTQIMIAIPTVLLLLARTSARTLFAVAFLLLVFPWVWLLGEPALVLVYAAAAGFLATSLLGWSPSVALRTALGVVLVSGVVIAVGNYFGPAYVSHFAAHVSSALAQGSWQRFVQSHWSSTGIAWWVAKAPTWAGLVLLALGCAYAVSSLDATSTLAGMPANWNTRLSIGENARTRRSRP